MALLEIKKYPNPILREKCQEVKEVTPEIRNIIEGMKKIVEKDQSVAGLAAPQIGISKRIIVVETERGAEGFINPKIFKKTKETEIDWEGCLSLPGIFVKIKRWAGVEIEALNEKGEKIQFRVTGFLARVFQDEIDHLNGILIIDHVSKLERFKLRDKLKELEKNYGFSR